MYNGSKRIGCIERLKNSSEFLCGSKDWIKIHDIRAKNSNVKFSTEIESECCGLAVNNQYFVTGFNNGSVILWDIRTNRKINHLKKYHGSSAVKALAWCPWKPTILATGGGEKDKNILFWDSFEGVTKGKMASSSQITKLLWKTCDKLLFSSHGNG